VTGRGEAVRRGSAAARVALILVLLTIWPRAVGAAAKDYYFPEVRIEIAVERDGSFVVDEYRTFAFQGEFSFAWIAIPLRAGPGGYRNEVSISEFEVRDERGQALRTETGTGSGRFSAKWSFAARDERRTFHIRYRVRGGVTSYPEATELYWQAVGDEWDKPAGNVTVTVILPEAVEGAGDLLVWGHGPLAGRSEIVDRRTARFTSPRLASRQPFEIRVVWPAGLVAGVPSDRHTLESIRREEEAFVRETIERARRENERAEARRARFLKAAGVWGLWQIAGPLLWLLFFFRSWSAVGKDHRFDDLPEYVRELPSDLPPALVQTLMREGRDVTPAAFTATLFDLARRGYLTFEDRRTQKRTLFGSKDAVDTLMTLNRAPGRDAGLRPFEQDVLGFLFDTAAGTGLAPGASLRLDELREFLKKKPHTFQSWQARWTKAIRAEAKPLGFLEPASLRARNVFYAVTIPLGVLTLSPILLIVSAVLIPTLKRRAPDWARENALWKGLDRFLDDFSSFERTPPEAYKLWEHYLVFAILFGNAKKILKALPVILADERAAVPTWYLGAAGIESMARGGLAATISGLERAATSIQQASLSAAHYSSGRGGGFSGGGGRGGGGGGGGAG